MHILLSVVSVSILFYLLLFPAKWIDRQSCCWDWLEKVACHLIILFENMFACEEITKLVTPANLNFSLQSTFFIDRVGNKKDEIKEDKIKYPLF